MKKCLFNITVGLSLVLCLSVACNRKPKNGRTDTYSSGTIKFVSDESFSPIIEEEVGVFQSIYPNAKLIPQYTNELDAVNMLMKEQTCLAITTRRFTKREEQNLKDRRFLPVAVPLAYDGLALIVNKENPDTIISLQDLKLVLSGKVSKWDKLYPESKLGDIEVAFDNKQSSTVHFCVDSLLDGKPINSPNIYAVKKSAEVIDFVEKHPNSIGIIGSNWLNDKRDTTNVTFKKNITVMAVSRIHPPQWPAAGNLTSSTYIMATIRWCAQSTHSSTTPSTDFRGDSPTSLQPTTAVSSSSTRPACCHTEPTWKSVR